MLAGQHQILLSKEPQSGGRHLGWELRDTLLILLPGPSLLFATLYRVPLQESTVAGQILANGQGALWIDGSRVGPPRNDKRPGRGAESGNHGRGLPSLSRDWGAWEATKGRWPPNLLLVHHPECVQDGTKKVKPGNGSGRAHGVNASAGNVYGGGKGLISQAKGDDIGGFVSEDGLETVQAWQCHASCPVGLLDRQSGVSASAVRRGGEGEHLDFSKTSWRFKRAQGGFTDTGGASRFFPQFRNLPLALDWLARLTNDPGEWVAPEWRQGS